MDTYQPPTVAFTLGRKAWGAAIAQLYPHDQPIVQAMLDQAPADADGRITLTFGESLCDQISNAIDDIMHDHLKDEGWE